MLTPFDDYPIHSSGAPIAHPATGDSRHYDRYFFNGHDVDGTIYIGGAMGHYPVRAVVDGAFSIAVDGVQHSVFASGKMPFDRETRVGPLRIEVVEPLRSIRYIVEPNDSGIVADVIFRARTVVVEEPRTQRFTDDGVPVMDHTRLTQWGSWQGAVEVAGKRYELDPTKMFGTRDRSWGVRPMAAESPSNREPWSKQVFFVWAPLHFSDICTHLTRYENEYGEAWMSGAKLVPLLEKADAPTYGHDPTTELAGIEQRIEWQPGTREMKSAQILMTEKDGTRHEIDFERCFSFRMRGLGYAHPEWMHGSVKGDLVVGAESIGIDSFEPLKLENLHVQTVCRVRWKDRSGIGVLEQFAMGPHHPSGLVGMMDGYEPNGLGPEAGR